MKKKGLKEILPRIWINVIIMITQHIELRKCCWSALLCYNVKPDNAAEVTHMLRELGCSRQNISHAYGLLSGGVPNQGFTYSDICSHRSIIVIGYVTSVGQFINTMSHELDHLADTISKRLYIPLDSEDNARMTGYIYETIYEDAMDRLISICPLSRCQSYG